MIHIFSEASADDLMREAIGAVLRDGEKIAPSRGAARELAPVVLELTNPLARLSRSEARGRVFSALAETLWYLSRSNDRDFIGYYIDYYKQRGETTTVWGGYGNRLFDFDGVDQVNYVVTKLRSNPFSRQAVIQLFDHRDFAGPADDVPCTCTLQFLVRSGALQAITYMRSNDAHLGLPHDIFAFTFLQELVARSVEVPVGRYVHVVGSFHLYEKDLGAAEQFLAEGWQANTTMPEMPQGDPWGSVNALLEIENAIRTGELDPMDLEFKGHDYWADLALLVAIFTLWKSGRYAEVEELRTRLSSEIYQVYIGDKLTGS